MMENSSRTANWVSRYFLFGILAFGCIAWLQEKKPQEDFRKNLSFSFNERFPSFSASHLNALAFGYSHSFAAFLWMRFLQETPPEKIPEHAVSWIYRDLDTVLDIDPDFYPAAQYGGVFLATITEDYYGAERLLKKGIALFPQNWRLYAYLGYLYQFELHEEKKAAEIYSEGAKQPGASFLLGVLAAKLLAETNSVESGIAFLKNLLQDTKDPKVRAHLEEKLENLEKKQNG